MIADQLRRFGVSNDVFHSLWDACGGVRPICLRPFVGSKNDGACIDHDHQTGLIRGLICGYCNMAIGLLGDDPHRFLRAVAYLEAASSTNFLGRSRFIRTGVICR